MWVNSFIQVEPHYLPYLLIYDIERNVVNSKCKKFQPGKLQLLEFKINNNNSNDINKKFTGDGLNSEKWGQ